MEVRWLTDSYTIYTAALNAAVQLTSEWSLVLCQYDEEQYKTSAQCVFTSSEG